VAVFDVFLADCPARTTLGVIGNTWVAVVLVALGEEPRRYTELQARIGGISKKMLTQTLRRVSERGLVTRCDDRRYTLTDLGQTLLEPISELVRWAEENAEAMLDATDAAPATR
jgi:DNA-binding HxlR family transcriptional regulator